MGAVSSLFALALPYPSIPVFSFSRFARILQPDSCEPRPFVALEVCSRCCPSKPVQDCEDKSIDGIPVNWLGRHCSDRRRCLQPGNEWMIGAGGPSAEVHRLAASALMRLI